MNKFIYYLIILCSMLLLYSCGDGHSIPNGNNLTPGFNITLIDDEQQKFNALKGGFDTIIKYCQNQLINNSNLGTKEKNQYQKIVNKYPDFIEWLSNHPQKQEELTDFTIVYEFLNEKRVQQASNLTNEQLIINTINCEIQSQNNKCNDNNYVYNDKKNDLFSRYFIEFFFNFLIHMNNTKTNEEIFESMKLEPYRYIHHLIGLNRYENAVRKTLDHNQKNGLDFLKEALSDELILHNLLLILNKNKIKAVLNHIHSELNKCSSNEQGKNIFKNILKDYFDIIDKNKLDEFQEKVKSGC